MRYMMTDNGEVIDAKDATDLVDQMRVASWDTNADRGVWMRETAQRLHDHMGVEVSTKNAGEFVRDLENAGVIKKKDD